jgi:LytS/YehU family sensor histidine kinase
MVSLNWIWHYFMQQKESQQRSIDAERLSREAELSKLRQQLQPHFLFNSLNSISALAGNRPEEARKMIQQLSDFLRGTLRKDEQQMLSLEEELKHLQLYLDIEKVRFGHRLNTVIEVQEHLLDLQIPALLLQPIVENAIKFGLYDTIGEISILVNAHQDAGNLVITVKNPFDPITSKPNEGTGFGLSSVNRRLYLLFARNDLLYTKTQENNFISSIKIPQII